jgi:hypothetical protein
LFLISYILRTFKIDDKDESIFVEEINDDILKQ